ncbi:MAG: glycosyltransferase 87 family protein [Actinomycetota bacterium]
MSTDRQSKVIAIALAVLITGVGLIAGFLLKRPCAGPGITATDPYRKDCYSDITFLYPRKDSPGGEPGSYKPFSLGGIAYRDNNLEYPALTGLTITVANVFVAQNDAAGFLSRNAIVLSIITLIGAGCLAAVSQRKWRIVLLAIAPALISYAFHNWDLLPMGLMCVGIWAYTRKKDSLAGAMLGLGAAAKVFPGLLVPALFLARRKQGVSPYKLVRSSVIWFAVPNLIVLAYAGSAGWWYPWKFQSQRFPNFETLAYFLYQHLVHWFPRWSFLYDPPGHHSTYARDFQISSLVVFAAASIWLFRREYRRPEGFRPIVCGMGIVILFLLTGKVYSPQYAVWLLPFFVLLDLPWWAYAAFAITDMLVLSLIWAYFTRLFDAQAAHATMSAWPLHLLEIGVFIRYAALGLILWRTRSSRELIDSEDTVIAPTEQELAPITP